MKRLVLGRTFHVHFRDHRSPVRGNDSFQFSALTCGRTISAQPKTGNRREREVRATLDPRSDQNPPSSDAHQSDVGGVVQTPEVNLNHMFGACSVVLPDQTIEYSLAGRSTAPADERSGEKHGLPALRCCRSCSTGSVSPSFHCSPCLGLCKLAATVAHTAFACCEGCDLRRTAGLRPRCMHQLSAF